MCILLFDRKLYQTQIKVLLQSYFFSFFVLSIFTGLSIYSTVNWQKTNISKIKKMFLFNILTHKFKPHSSLLHLVFVFSWSFPYFLCILLTSMHADVHHGKHRLIRSTHSLCCELSGSSWRRPGWLCRWSSAHETQFLRSIQASCCEAQSDFPSSCSGTLSTGRHIPGDNCRDILSINKDNILTLNYCPFAVF